MSNRSGTPPSRRGEFTDPIPGREPLPDGVEGYAIGQRRPRTFPELSTPDSRGQRAPAAEQSAAGRSVIGGEVDWVSVIATGALTFEVVHEVPADGRDVAAEWATILNHGWPSSRHWELVAAAIDNADRVLAHESGPDITRGGRRWCELASDTYQFASGHGLERRLAAVAADRCLNDAEAIRTWLAAPMPGTAASIVADRLDTAKQFADHTRVEAAAVTRLLGAAQDAGVFGIPHRRIQTRADGSGGLVLVDHVIKSHIIDDDHAPGAPHREHLELGLGKPLARIVIDDLLAARVTGVDAAITVLTRTADVINAALHPTDPRPGGQTQRSSQGPDAAARGRPFPPPRLDQRPGTPPTRPGPASATPEAGRSR